MNSLVVGLLLLTQQPMAGSPPPAPQAVSTQTDLQQRIEVLLGTRDVAVTPQQWRALGPGALPELERLAADASALPTRRARAIEGLVALGSPRAPKLLVRLAQSETQPFVVRLAAVRGAGRTLSASRQLVALRPVLDSAREPALRGAAAEVLSRHASGCEAVMAQAERETEDWRSRFHVAMNRCAKASP